MKYFILFTSSKKVLGFTKVTMLFKVLWQLPKSFFGLTINFDGLSKIIKGLRHVL